MSFVDPAEPPAAHDPPAPAPATDTPRIPARPWYLRWRAAGPDAEGAEGAEGAGHTRRFFGGGVPAMFSRAAAPLGIDVGSRRLKLVALDPNARVPTILRWANVPLPRTMVGRDRILDPGGLTEELSRTAETLHLPRALATCVVGGQDVFVRRLTMPRMTKIEALRQLPTNPQFKLPTLNLTDTKLEIEILDPHSAGPTMSVLVVAARKEAISVRQRVALHAGFDIYAVDVDSFALFNAFDVCQPAVAKGRVTLVHIGHDASLIVVAESGAPVIARHIDIGVGKLIDNLLSGGILTAETAEGALFSPGANPVSLYPDGVNAWAEEMAEEIRRTAANARADAQTGAVYLSGGGALVDGIAETIQSHLRTGAEVAVFDPSDFLAVAPTITRTRRGEGTAYAIALGLALRQIL